MYGWNEREGSNGIGGGGGVDGFAEGGGGAKRSRRGGKGKRGKGGGGGGSGGGGGGCGVGGGKKRRGGGGGGGGGRPQLSAEEKLAMKFQFRGMLQNQLTRLRQLKCPAALAACCSIAGDLWRVGDTKGVRCIISQCFAARDSERLVEVLTALNDKENVRERNSEIPLKLYTWSLPELLLTTPEFGGAAVDIVNDLLIPGKTEFVQPLLSTREYFMRHTYFNALETVAEVEAVFQRVPHVLRSGDCLRTSLRVTCFEMAVDLAKKDPGKSKKKKGDKRKQQKDEAKDYNEGKEVVMCELQGTVNGSFFERMPVRKDSVLLVPRDYQEAPGTIDARREDPSAVDEKPFYWGTVQNVTKAEGRDVLELVMQRPMPKKGGTAVEGEWVLLPGPSMGSFSRLMGAVQDLCCNTNYKKKHMQSILLNPVKDASQSDQGVVPMVEQTLTGRDLNEKQRMAVAQATRRTTGKNDATVTLIQGPPGTGKTHTSVEIICRWMAELRQDNHAILLMAAAATKPKTKFGDLPGDPKRGGGGFSMGGFGGSTFGAGRRGSSSGGGGNGGGGEGKPKCEQILVTGYSNIAVNNIMAGLLKHGVKALRVGHGHGMDSNTLQSESENDPRWPEFKRLKDQFRGQEASRLRFMIEEKLLDAAEVICATCMTAGADMLAKRPFSRVLLDEATQSTEIATIVPLVDTCQHLVLVGDHRQLPPTILSYKAQLAGLAESLFERFIRLGYPYTMMDIQFRMHPAIAEFPAAQWYEGRLSNGVGPEARLAPGGVGWPDKEQPVAFVNVGDEFSRQLEAKSYSGSKFNPAEAELVARIVFAVLAAGDVPASEIAVITPYAGQVRELNKRVKHTGVRVDSVDAFQGMERDLVIVSAVRANAYGDVGFLKDPRRMNVLLTRARRGLVVVGHERTLRHDEVWHNWLEWVHSKRLIGSECSIVPDGRGGRGAVEPSRQDFDRRRDYNQREEYSQRSHSGGSGYGTHKGHGSSSYQNSHSVSSYRPGTLGAQAQAHYQAGSLGAQAFINHQAYHQSYITAPALPYPQQPLEPPPEDELVPPPPDDGATAVPADPTVPAAYDAATATAYDAQYGPGMYAQAQAYYQQYPEAAAQYAASTQTQYISAAPYNAYNAHTGHGGNDARFQR